MSSPVGAVENVDYQKNERSLKKTYRKPQLLKKNITKTIPKNNKPGRPRRKARTWFTDEELRQARRILGFNAPRPPRCICGKEDWAFNVKDERLRARCRRCQYEQWLNYRTWRWTLEARDDEAHYEDKT